MRELSPSIDTIGGGNRDPGRPGRVGCRRLTRVDDQRLVGKEAES